MHLSNLTRLKRSQNAVRAAGVCVCVCVRERENERGNFNDVRMNELKSECMSTK